MASIFDKVRLRPTQLRTVADRRFDDAQALRNTNDNARANGAIYLAGFVIECLLKAKLLEKHPWLGAYSASPAHSKSENYLWSLCYRSHDLSELLAHVPEVRNQLQKRQPRDSSRLLRNLSAICGQWTIHARYSPRTAKIDDAADFLSKVKELKKWLM